MAAGDITANRGKASDRKCAVFDGVDDSVSLGALGVEFNGGFTLCAWVMRKDQTKQVILSMPDGDNFFFNYNNGGDDLRIYASDLTPASLTVATGIGTYVWTHTLLTFDGVNSTIYINGVSKGTQAHTGTLDTAGLVASLGAGDWLNGCLSDVKLFSRELTQTEITAVVAGSSVTDLIHRWKLADDYTDSVGSFNGTNSGTYLTNTLPNRLMADAETLNLTAVTDKIIALPRTERDGQFTIVGANREA